jgi:hypothetical protein
MTQAPDVTLSRAPSHPLIESNRVEGTRVFDRDAKQIGTIHHLVIEKVTGRVVYAVMSFGGFLGLGAHLYTVPWEKLHFDPGLGGYHTDITEGELEEAPQLPHDADRQREEELRRYWNLPSYWA